MEECGELFGLAGIGGAFPMAKGFMGISGQVGGDGNGLAGRRIDENNVAFGCRGNGPGPAVGFELEL